MRNPLSMALGMVLKSHKDTYRSQAQCRAKDLNEEIADRTAISVSLLGGLEAGTHQASQATASRLVLSPYYPLSHSRFLLLVGVLESLGKQFQDKAHFQSRVDTLLEAVDVEALSDILKLCLLIPESMSTTATKFKIHELGLFSAVYKFVSTNHELPLKKRTKYFAEFAKTEAQILTMIDLWGDLLDGRAPDPQVFLNRWRKNPQMATIIYSDDTCENIVGYYVLTPLSEQAVTSLMTAKYRLPREIPNEDICSSYSEAHGLFLSFIAGMNKYANAHVIAEMFRQISSLVHSPNITSVFTRHASHEGKHLMDKFGFGLIKGSEISVLTLTQDKLEQFQVDRVLSYR